VQQKTMATNNKILQKNVKITY